MIIINKGYMTEDGVMIDEWEDDNAKNKFTNRIKSKFKNNFYTLEESKIQENTYIDYFWHNRLNFLLSSYLSRKTCSYCENKYTVPHYFFCDGRNPVNRWNINLIHPVCKNCKRKIENDELWIDIYPTHDWYDGTFEDWLETNNMSREDFYKMREKELINAIKNFNY